MQSFFNKKKVYFLLVVHVHCRLAATVWNPVGLMAESEDGRRWTTAMSLKHQLKNDACYFCSCFFCQSMSQGQVWRQMGENI